MEFKLQSFSTPLRVTRIANIHYFEFTHQYHTESDSHNEEPYSCASQRIRVP